MSATSQITVKFQVTLPKEVREELGARVGDRLAFVKAEDGSWRVLVIPKNPIKALELAGKALTPGNFIKLHDEYERELEDAERG